MQQCVCVSHIRYSHENEDVEEVALSNVCIRNCWKTRIVLKLEMNSCRLPKNPNAKP